MSLIGRITQERGETRKKREKHRREQNTQRRFNRWLRRSNHAEPKHKRNAPCRDRPMTSWVKLMKTSEQSHKEENTREKKGTTDEKGNGVVDRTDTLLFTQAKTGRMATAKTHRCKRRSIRCDPEKLPRNPRSNQNQIKRTLILPKLLGHAIESTKRLSQKEILEKDSPTLRISTGQSERDESSRMNEEHMIHPAAILKG